MDRGVLRYLVFVLFFAGVCGYAHSQANYQNTWLNKQHGLSSNDITAIVQDKLGFIWIGTENGLSRYDGYTFRNYYKSSDDSSGLCHNSILGMYVDRNNTLWIGTPFGISSFVAGKNKFCNYYYLAGSDSALHSVKYFYESKDNELFCISTEGFIYKYNREKDCFSNSISFGSRSISVAFNSDDELWLGNEHGLKKFSFKQNGFVPDKIFGGKLESLSGKVVFSLYNDENYLWAGTIGDGLYRFNKRTGEVFHYGGSIETVYAISKDANNILWIGEGNGLFSMDRKSNQFKQQIIAYSAERPNDLKTVSCIFIDSQQSLWIGMRYNGLNLRFKNKSFNNLTTTESSDIKLSKDIVTSVYVDKDGTLLVGYFRSGVDAIENQKGKYSIRRFDHSKILNFPKGSVFQFFETGQGDMLIVSQQGGIHRFNPKTGECIPLPVNTNNIDLLTSDIRSIAQSDKDNLWLAIHGQGLVHIDLKAGITHKFNSISEKNNTISNDWTFDVLVDNSKQVWICSAYGVSRYLGNGQFKRYVYAANDTLTLSNSYSNTLFEDSKQRIWVGTIEGLNLYDPQHDCFIRVVKDKSSRKKNILGILEDDKGNLWISTNEGITRYNFDTKTSMNFTEYDGLGSNEFMRNACFKAKDGQLYFGHSNGITVFHPDSIVSNELKPSVHIVDVKLFNQSILTTTSDMQFIYKGAKLEFDYSSNVISFEYAALNYIVPQKNSYAYKLEGFDKEWHYVGAKRDVTYTNLDPGKYRFRVIASNNDAVWNNEGTYLDLIIKPPFWKTLFFRMTISLLVFGLIIFTFYLRVRNVNNRNRLLEALVNKRTSELKHKSDLLLEQTRQLNEKNIQLKDLNGMKDKLFSVVAHDLKNPLGTVLGFTDFLRQYINTLEPDQIVDYLQNMHQATQKTYDLLDSMLEWGRTRSGLQFFEKRNYKLKDLIESVVDNLKELARGKKIQIETSYADVDMLIDADKNMFSAIIRNLISNAIKYSYPDSKVIVDCQVSDDSRVEIHVFDYGVGMLPEQLNNLFKIDKVKSVPGSKGESGHGFGLLITKDYVEKHNGTISAESEIGKGSVFTVSLPK